MARPYIRGAERNDPPAPHPYPLPETGEGDIQKNVSAIAFMRIRRNVSKHASRDVPHRFAVDVSLTPLSGERAREERMKVAYSPLIPAILAIFAHFAISVVT